MFLPIHDSIHSANNALSCCRYGGINAVGGKSSSRRERSGRISLVRTQHSVEMFMALPWEPGKLIVRDVVYIYGIEGVHACV